MSEWKEYKLGELISTISDTYKFSDDEVVFLNTSDIYLGKIINRQKFRPKDLPGQAKKRIQEGDLLFSEIRPANGRYALVKQETSNYVVSTKLMVLRCKGKIHPEYLNIFLTSKEMLEYLQMIAEDRSGTFPQITFDNLAVLEIFLPSLTEQAAIAEILSSLDDKIDLLHRQNLTLEQLAETLFRKWFVEEAEESWEEKPLSEIATYLNGLACQKYPPKGGDALPVIKIKEMRTGFTDSTDKATANVPEQYLVDVGDVVFSWSGSLDIG